MKADEVWPAFSRPFQITMTYVPPETRRVVANCPNYPDAMVTLERLINDPRHELRDVLMFEVFDYEGKPCDYAQFDR